MSKVVECTVVEVLSNPIFNYNVGYFEIDVKYRKAGGKVIHKGVCWNPDINKIQEITTGHKFYIDE